MCMELHQYIPAEQLDSQTASLTTNFAAISEAGSNAALNLVIFRTESKEF